MRKFILIFIASLFYLIGNGQTYPIPQNIGSANTLVQTPNYGGFRSGLIPYTFADTAAANVALSYLKNYNGAEIFTTDCGCKWYRYATLNKWVQLIPAGIPTADTLYWRLNGNDLSSYSALPTIGTISNDPFFIQTNNLKRIGIAASGIAPNSSNVVPLGIDTAGNLLAYSNGGGSGFFDATVDFSINTNPNDPGTTFNPNTPGLTTVVYVSTLDGNQWTYNGSMYVTFKALGWAIIGNAGTTPGVNYLGTSDGKGLMIKINGEQSGYLDFDYNNTSFGYQTMFNNTPSETEGLSNTAFGFQVLSRNTTGNDNTAIGNEALLNNTTGTRNVAIGNYAGAYNTTASNQFFLNAIPHSTYAQDTALSLVYGGFAAATANQKFIVNAQQVRFPYIPNGTGVSALRIDASGNLYKADTAIAPNDYWKLTGNSGTSSSTNFIGTTDGQSLIIKTNNLKRGEFDTDYNVAFGNSVNAIGGSSAAFGEGTTASGFRSFAIGKNSVSAEDLSFSGGENSSSTKRMSFTFGDNNVSKSILGTVFGENNKAQSYSGLVIGTYNDTTDAGDPEANDPENRLFQIGNGTDNTTRSNVMTVLQNGRSGFGTTAPTAKVEIAAGSTALAPLKFNAGAPATSLVAGQWMYNTGLFIYDSSGSKRDTVASRSYVRALLSGVGSGTVTSFTFTDGNGFDGTVTNSTTTPTLSLTTQLTTGSIPIIGASGALSQSNANLFWNTSIGAAGALGVGTNSLSSWSNDQSIIQLGATASFIAEKNATVGSGFSFSNNAYFDGSVWRYMMGDAASNYYQANGTHNWRVVGSGSTGASISWTNAMKVDASGNVGIGTTSPSTQLHTTGGVRFAGIGGAGSVTSDANGNLSVVSDVRLKDIKGNYGGGLRELMKIKPIVYKWNEKSGLETSSTYIGFSAQNIQQALGNDAVGKTKDGYLTLQDRAIIATLVQAVKEQQKQIEELKLTIKNMKP